MEQISSMEAMEPGTAPASSPPPPSTLFTVGEDLSTEVPPFSAAVEGEAGPGEADHEITLSFATDANSAGDSALILPAPSSADTIVGVEEEVWRVLFVVFSHLDCVFMFGP